MSDVFGQIHAEMQNQAPPAGASDVFSQIHAETSAPPAEGKGVWAGVKRNTVGMVAGLYHAFTDPATDQEKTDLRQKVDAEKQWQIQHGYDPKQVDDSFAENPSRATLALHRLVDAPAGVLAKKGWTEQQAAKELLAQGENWKGGNLYLSGATDKLLSAVPMAGPWLNSVAERFEKGDASGAATDIASALALSHAPTAVKALANKAGETLAPLAPKLYQSALKPSPASYSTAEVANMVKTGLENKIPISAGGIDKLHGLVKDLNTAVQAEIDAGASRGATVNKYAVTGRLSDMGKKFQTQVNPEADLNAIGESGNEFLRNQPNEIPASQAQKLKTGTYQQLGNKAYGELKSSTMEAQKALARGIKEELETQFPEIKGLNAKESQLYNLQPAIERAVRRIDNHDVISLGSKAVGGAGAVLGGAPGAVAGTVLEKVLGMPTVKSQIAIALNTAGKGKIPISTANARVAAYVAALQSANAEKSDEQQPAQ